MKTPRTDAALDENWWFTERPSLNPKFADFARELERENARLRAENVRLRAFAEAVRVVTMRPIDASDAMDEIDDLVCGRLDAPGSQNGPRGL